MSFYVGNEKIAVALITVEPWCEKWCITAKDTANNIYAHYHLFSDLDKANKIAMDIIDAHVNLDPKHWVYSHTRS